jgi:1,4-dihydroxy-6-naphthoate synthase
MIEDGIPMTGPASLRIAYTPDSDDAFNFYAWEHGRVALPVPGPRPEFHRQPIDALNGAARQERFDVVAVSSVVYPQLADAYWVLATGNSVGRGWGPVLASRRYDSLRELAGKRVAVAGRATTGATLARLYGPECELVEMPYDRIADAILAGTVDAGVMIHEELLHFPARGLRCVADLGRSWCEETSLPLPVGLNLVRRSLGLELARQIAATCQASLRWALEHPEEAYAFALRFGRGLARRHVAMFSNADTLRAPDDVRRAMRLLFDRVAALGLGPSLGSFEIVDAPPSAA